jgi:hypothetical protein
MEARFKMLQVNSLTEVLELALIDGDCPQAC